MSPEPVLLHSVTIGVADVASALTFYDAVLGALGLVRVGELVDEEEDGAEVEAVGWGRPDGDPVLWVVRAHVLTTGLHVRLDARSRVEVETFYAAGIANGGSGRAAPRPWTLYRRGEFGAMVADAAGNVLEAVAADVG